MNTSHNILYLVFFQSRKSKWDKPKEPPPPPINRTQENGDNRDDEQNDAESTSTRISRFRELERGDDERHSHRKPMHKVCIASNRLHCCFKHK